MFIRAGVLVLLSTIISRIGAPCEKQLIPTFAVIMYIDTEYFDIEASNVTINTGDTLSLNLKVTKPFSPKIKIMSELIRLDKGEKATRLYTYNETICGDSCQIKGEYLPFYLRQLANCGKCPKEGMYKIANAGQVRFEKLLKPNKLEGAFTHEIITSIMDGNERILVYITFSDFV